MKREGQLRDLEKAEMSEFEKTYVRISSSEP